MVDAGMIVKKEQPAWISQVSARVSFRTLTPCNKDARMSNEASIFCAVSTLEFFSETIFVKLPARQVINILTHETGRNHEILEKPVLLWRVEHTGNFLRLEIAANLVKSDLCGYQCMRIITIADIVKD